MLMGFSSRYRQGHVRAHQSRCIDNNDELESWVIDPTGKKKRAKETIINSWPVSTGTVEGSVEDARDPLNATSICRSRYHRKSQRTADGRTKYEYGLASCAKNNRVSASEKKLHKDVVAGNIEKTCSNQLDGVRDLIKGNSNVVNEPNLSPKAFRIASGMHSEQNHEKRLSKFLASSHFNSWCWWPFKHQMILIDLTTSTGMFSSYREALYSVDDFRATDARKSPDPRQSFPSSHSNHKISRVGSEIDELLDKLVDGPMTRLTETVDAILDFICIARMCNPGLYNLKNSSRQ